MGRARTDVLPAAKPRYYTTDEEPGQRAPGGDCLAPAAGLCYVQAIIRRSAIHRRARPYRRNGWRILSSVNALTLAALWIGESIVGERHWFFASLLYVPQWPFLLPAALLLLAALVRRDAPDILVNVLAAGLFAWALVAWNPGRLFPIRDAATRQTIRVMTYNIDGGRGGMERVADVVRRENPDIVCLQEAGSGVADGLAKRIPAYHVASMLRGVAVLTRLKSVQDRAVVLESDDARATLALAETVVETKPRGRRVTVASAHFLPPHGGPGLANIPREMIPTVVTGASATRVQQAEILTEHLDGNVGPLIVCGDFNTPPRGPLYNTVSRNGRDDAWNQAGRGFGNTRGGRRPLVRIDFVLVRNGIDTRAIHVPATQASDHRPVVADLLLPTK